MSNFSLGGLRFGSFVVVALILIVLGPMMVLEAPPAALTYDETATCDVVLHYEDGITDRKYHTGDGGSDVYIVGLNTEQITYHCPNEVYSHWHDPNYTHLSEHPRVRDDWNASV